jgi:hypothetical protein
MENIDLSAMPDHEGLSLGDAEKKRPLIHPRASSRPLTMRMISMATGSQT